MLNDAVIANKSYAKMNVSSNETLDEIALKVLKQDCPEFLLPTKTMNIDGEIEIRYELSEGIRMEYVPLKMKKKEFAQLLLNMLTPFKTCSDWFLDYHSILLDKKYILLGKDDYAVKYAYIPVKERAMTDGQMKSFFDDLIISAEVTDDPGYTMMLFRTFKDKDATLMTLLEFVSQNAPQMPIEVDVEVKTQSFVSQVINAIPEVKIPETPVIETVKSAVKVEKINKEFGKKDMQADILGGLFGEEDDEPETDRKKNKKGAKAKEVKGKEPKNKEPKNKEQSSKGLFGGLFSGKKEEEDVAPIMNNPVQPVYVQNEVKRQESKAYSYAGFESDATEIGDEEESVVRKDKLTLRLKDGAGFKCPPVIELDLSKGYATIGRFDKLGAKQSDFNFDATFSFISRVHARVELVGDEWRMIDLSKNGTFLNGSVLASNIPYTLSSGDVVTFTKKHSISYVVC